MIALPHHRKGIYSMRGYVFVERDHDIIKIMMAKHRAAGIDLRAFPLVDNTYFKTTPAAIANLCTTMALPKLKLLQRWFRTTIILHRRLAVAMALHPRLGRARTPPPLGPVRMRVCGLAKLKEDVIVKILSIAAPMD
jgi:hypothetical protein